jgi:hypothetical protein
MSQNFKDTALIIFVRLPVPGKVKSRLAESLGAQAAAALYRECAENLFRECSLIASGLQVFIFYCDRQDKAAVERWAGQGFRFSPQRGRSLGRRLENALGEVFGSGAARAVVMASDVPDLSAGLINDAINSLDDYNIVVGSSCDGGYYLLGLRNLHRELFRGISWSTDRVLSQTLDAAGRLGMSVKMMPQLRDIDTVEDLREWMETAATDNPVLQYLRRGLPA